MCIPYKSSIYFMFLSKTIWLTSSTGFCQLNFGIWLPFIIDAFGRLYDPIWAVCVRSPLSMIFVPVFYDTRPINWCHNLVGSVHVACNTNNLSTPLGTFPPALAYDLIDENKNQTLDFLQWFLYLIKSTIYTSILLPCSMPVHTLLEFCIEHILLHL